ncbi:hypothetical protein ILUMI_01580 [Ignelater luminosus]|uniref:DDE Tnp4 domain-containing protein n=1 Tax=Ignelater luminosus TaxID=2038154 RepID=A0A8K0DE50_IGNLU|nr:hypothetical protein ILUMI_01580 [Ignelater luminosus]
MNSGKSSEAVNIKTRKFLAVSYRFGFSKGAGHYIFLKVFNPITQLKEQFITWPDARQCNQIASRIENHYQIKQSVNNAVDFFNRKEAHSILLQAVCDDNCLLIAIPGRVHDAWVFRQSPLYHQLASVPSLVSAGRHLFADAAYLLMTNVLKPYRDNGQLSQKQIKSNQTLSTQRTFT